MTETEAKFISAMEAFVSAAYQLETAWTQLDMERPDRPVDMASPFPMSFDEWTDEVSAWVETVKRERFSQE